MGVKVKTRRAPLPESDSLNALASFETWGGIQTNEIRLTYSAKLYSSIKNTFIKLVEVFSYAVGHWYYSALLWYRTIIFYCRNLWTNTPQSRNARHQKIERLPLHHFELILGFIFPKKSIDRIFGQIVADVRDSYLEALVEGKEFEASKIKFWARFEVLHCMFFFLWDCSLGKLLRSIWKTN